MRRSILWALLVLFSSALPAAPATALELGTYTMEILVDGRPLAEHHARGRHYIEAAPSAEYAVRLSNHTAQRVAVALSVDGLNSIDAKTTSSRDAAKWILGPYQTITVSGWQTSLSTARRFFFTTEERSYGAWLGKTDHLGIISAAFFREKRPRPAPITRDEERKRSGDAAGRRESPSRLGQSREAAPSADAEGSALSDDLAATGIGREIDHGVRRVRFDAERRPVHVVEVRYEYRDALVRLGVLPSDEAPLARRESARGFTDTGFAPDPFRCD